MMSSASSQHGGVNARGMPQNMHSWLGWTWRCCCFCCCSNNRRLLSVGTVTASSQRHATYVLTITMDTSVTPAANNTSTNVIYVPISVGNAYACHHSGAAAKRCTWSVAGIKVLGSCFICFMWNDSSLLVALLPAQHMKRQAWVTHVLGMIQ